MNGRGCFNSSMGLVYRFSKFTVYKNFRVTIGSKVHGPSVRAGNDIATSVITPDCDVIHLGGWIQLSPLLDGTRIHANCNICSLFHLEASFRTIELSTNMIGIVNHIDESTELQVE